MPGSEAIISLAQYFGVSADYLLGLTDAPTTDADLRAVCDYTGLSEGAVERLAAMKAAGEYGELLDLLSYLLKGNNGNFFTAVIAYIDARLHDLDEPSADEQPSILEESKSTGIVMNKRAFTIVVPPSLAASTMLGVACNELRQPLIEYADAIVAQAAARAEGGTDDGDD